MRTIIWLLSMVLGELWLLARTIMVLLLTSFGVTAALFPALIVNPNLDLEKFALAGIMLTFAVCAVGRMREWRVHRVFGEIGPLTAYVMGLHEKASRSKAS